MLLEERTQRVDQAKGGHRSARGDSEVYENGTSVTDQFKFAEYSAESSEVDHEEPLRKTKHL